MRVYLNIKVGNPYNVWQYWVLHKLICHEVGIEPGEIVFSITIPHIYDRHLETIKKQIHRYEELKKEEESMNGGGFKEIEVALDLKGFYDFSSKDVKVSNYDSFGGEPLKVFRYEVAE